MLGRVIRAARAAAKEFLKPEKRPRTPTEIEYESARNRWWDEVERTGGPNQELYEKMIDGGRAVAAERSTRERARLRSE